MLDRNLGATTASIRSNESAGLLYQWGRKDPMIGSLNDSYHNNRTAFVGDDVDAIMGDETTGTISYSISHPTTYITYNNVSSINYDWYYTGTQTCDNTRWTSSKTIYDPCPVGWRVPDGIGSSVWEVANNGSTAFNSSDFTFYSYSTPDYRGGIDCSSRFAEDEYSTTIWYPYTGSYGITPINLESIGKISYYTKGEYWTCTPLPADQYGYNNVSVFSCEASSLRFTYGFRYKANPVRCQKN